VDSSFRRTHPGKKVRSSHTRPVSERSKETIIPLYYIMDASGVLLTSAVPESEPGAPPTPPAVVPVPTSTTATLLSLKEVTSGLTDVSKLQSELVKIISEVITKMPQTQAEALEMYQTLSVKLSTLLVSQLPGLEQKAATMALWALDAVKNEAKGCFSFLTKK